MILGVVGEGFVGGGGLCVCVCVFVRVLVLSVCFVLALRRQKKLQVLGLSEALHFFAAPRLRSFGYGRVRQTS